MPRTNRNIPEPDSTGHIPHSRGTLPSGWRPSPFGAVPLPVLLGALAVFDILLPPPGQLGKGLVFEPAYLNAVLQTLFLAITSYAVAYISLKSYLQNGSTILVLLGSGALAWGSASLIAPWVATLPSGPNPGITISNTGALLAAILHTSSATLVSTGASPNNRQSLRKPLLVLSYGGVLAFTTIYAVASLEGLVPPFFILGVGQTLLRAVVLGTGATLFAISSLLFSRLYFSSSAKSGVLYWYFLALGLTGLGLAAVFFGRAPGDPISWTGRAAMFLGGVYFLKAVLTTFRIHPTP